MEIRRLEAFVAVAEELHFGRAAERLGMAQSPLSQTVRRLERELGTTLFERSTRSVALTPAGRALLPHVRRALDELELGREATRAVDGLVHGTVAIGFSGALNHHTLSPLTRAVRHRHPGVVLALTGRVVTGDGVALVERGALDIAFVGLPIEPSPLATRLVAREPLGVVLPIDHRLAGEPVVDLAELAGEPFVGMPASAGSALQRLTAEACARAGFRPEVVQESTDPFLVLTLVAAGVGVTVMASGIGPIVPPGAVYVPLRGEPTWMQHAIAWRADDPSPVLRAVLDVAEEVLPTPVD
ncbi:LysR substrate-binding domain-containing protein [Pseudonocardia spirodelae]|uniref:LysR substrate-binding domain-containing protein n=1 Tax=Pseudonocardia spirodelae TaxID=3133431 RepID=A0ABU8T6D8_9PSEU